MNKFICDNCIPNKKVAIVLPAYNEELTLQKTIEDFHTALPQASLYVVDNNSTDRSGEIARKTIKKLGIEGNVFFEPWQGKGNAVRRAFGEIDADIYIMADADNTYPAEECFFLIKPILDGEADMVVGDRISKGDYQRENDRPFHNLGNRLIINLVNFIGKTYLRDVMSGYRAMNRTFVHNYPLTVEGFQLETDLSLFAAVNRFRIKEIPIHYRNRPSGSFSKLNTYRDGSRVLLTVFNTFRYYKPFIFFTFFALLFALLSLATGFPVIQEYTTTATVQHIPLAILASSLGVLSVIFFAIGIILDSLTYFNQNITFIRCNNSRRKAHHGTPFFKD